jgi:lipopolysaccharide export system protein LptA
MNRQRRLPIRQARSVRALLATLAPMLVCVLASMLGSALAPAPVRAQPAGPNQPVTIEYADKIVGNEQTGVTELVGNVRIVQGVTRITADRAVHYRDGNRVELIGNVRVVQPGTTLIAPRANYDGNTRLATAPAGVTIRDGEATIRASTGTYDLYSRIASFSGGVSMTDPGGRVRAGSAQYFSNERRAVFTSGVVVTTDSGSISARELTYWRDTKELYAVGDVVVIPRDRRSKLTGQTLRHIPKAGYTVVTGAPRLVDIDTTDDGTPDTTVISAAKLESYRGEKHSEYIATDSVRMRRGDLEAMAARANYSPDDDAIGLGSGRRSSIAPAEPPPDSARAPAESSGAVTGVPLDTAATEPADATASPDPERFRSGVWPIVWFKDSQLSGDTITVRLREKKLRAIDVIGDALAVTQKKEPERFDQLAGLRLLFAVAEDTIRQVRSEQLASSVMFIEDEGKPNGAERVSADTVIVDFVAGEADVVSVYGPRARIEGDHYPEGIVAGQERTFRLDNFRWLPREADIASLKATLPKAPAIPPVENAPEGE